MMNQWEQYLDCNDNFQLGNYLYRNINELMKHSLDMGTLLSDDTHKLRAYKEQTKKLFKSKWYELAEVLEAMGVIEKCDCFNARREVFCDFCKGSRYRVSRFLAAEEIRDISTFTVNTNSETAGKLQAALAKIIDEVS